MRLYIFGQFSLSIDLSGIALIYSLEHITIDYMSFEIKLGTQRAQPILNHSQSTQLLLWRMIESLFDILPTWTRIVTKIMNKNEFLIQSEELVYKRFLKTWNRRVQYPNGRIFDWDIVGQPGTGPHFATVFPYFQTTKTIRLLQEYCQGTNQMLYTLVAGGFDDKKHKSIRETAMCEMEEEARLKGGKMVCLMDEESFGISELKWSRNRFIPFICIDPIESLEAKRDPEELIVFRDVSIQEFNDIIQRGEMMLPSVQTGIMALNWLQLNHYY